MSASCPLSGGEADSICLVGHALLIVHRRPVPQQTAAALLRTQQNRRMDAPPVLAILVTLFSTTEPPNRA
jgi:hypothetical protein